MSRTCLRTSAETRARARARWVFVLRVLQVQITFQRKFRVYDDGSRRVGQVQQTIRPLATGKGGLKSIGRRRQGRDYQVVELDFPKSAARLFIGKNILQSHHLGGKPRQVPLRPVDDREAFLQFGKRLVVLLGLALQAVAQALGHAIQAFVHGAVQFGGRAGLLIGHLGEPAAQFPLMIEKSGDGFGKLPDRFVSSVFRDFSRCRAKPKPPG